MTRFAILLASLAAAGLAASSAFAVAPDEDAVLGTDAATISVALAQDGYAVTHYAQAPAVIRITADHNGTRHRILVSPRDGTVISTQALTAGFLPSAASPATANAPNLAMTLAAQGYDLRRVKHEGHELEVYALRDGRLWELKLDPATGDILRIEAKD